MSNFYVYNPGDFGYEFGHHDHERPEKKDQDAHDNLETAFEHWYKKESSLRVKKLPENTNIDKSIMESFPKQSNFEKFHKDKSKKELAYIKNAIPRFEKFIKQTHRNFEQKLSRSPAASNKSNVNNGGTACNTTNVNVKTGNDPNYNSNNHNHKTLNSNGNINDKFGKNSGEYKDDHENNDTKAKGKNNCDLSDGKHNYKDVNVSGDLGRRKSDTIAKLYVLSQLHFRKHKVVNIQNAGYYLNEITDTYGMDDTVKSKNKLFAIHARNFGECFVLIKLKSLKNVLSANELDEMFKKQSFCQRINFCRKNDKNIVDKSIYKKLDFIRAITNQFAHCVADGYDASKAMITQDEKLKILQNIFDIANYLQKWKCQNLS